MKTIYLCLAMLFVSAPVSAQGRRHVLVIIKPAGDTVLLELADNTARHLRTVSFDRYEPEEQPVEASDETEALAKGKEAYEFLRFEESLAILHKAIERLNAHLNSEDSLETLREAYLYGAMDYLALDKNTDARTAVDAYLCIAGTPALDANLWPPNLLNLIQQELIGTHGSFVSVTVVTDPPETRITVDGNPAGISPAHLKLLRCTHSIRAEKKAYLTKQVPVAVSENTHRVNLKLGPDTLTISIGRLSREQIQSLISRYKTDTLLTLSRSVTQTTRQKEIWIQADMVDARTLAELSRTFAYNDPNHAAEALVRFVQPEQDTLPQEDIVRKSTDQNETEKNTPVSGAWYKNKWVWTAGAAIVAGCVIYALLPAGHPASSSTGGISVSW